MNILDAFYHTVHDVPGGCEALAPRMGMSAPILRNKADPRKDWHKVMLVDADKAMALTGDFRVLHALADAHDHVCLPVPRGVPVGDKALLDLITEILQTNGKVGAAVSETLADRRVEKSEVEKVRGCVYLAIYSLHAMLAGLEAMVDE